MRDIVLTAIVIGSIPFILRRPYIGVLMWVWLSVMNPHRLTWSFAFDFQFAAVIAVVTLVSVVISKERKFPPLNSLMVVLFMFVAWTGVTTIFAFYPAEAYVQWTTMMKTQLMAFLIPMLFHRKEQLRQLIWVIVLSIAYFGTKGGVWVILTGGQYHIWGPPGGYIEDNNSLAVAIVMIIPLMRYLQLTSPRNYVRWGLTGMMLLCSLSVLGSQSRGALVAVGAMVIFLLWKSKQKLPLFIVALIAIPAALSVMPDSWFKRMDTIANYEQDSSAAMRLNSWETMFNIAKDRPLVGGGFELASRSVYDRYAPDPTWPPQVAHSIYFQALGEHGFVGLALYLLLYWIVWRHAGALARATRANPDLAWAQNLGLMMQVSIVGFAAGGAFLSLVVYDVPYYLIGILIALRAIVGGQLDAAKNSPARAGESMPLSDMPAHSVAKPRGG